MSTNTDPWREWVTIHFKEDSIPSLRSGQLTEESIKALKALALSEALAIVGKDEDLYFGKSHDLNNMFKFDIAASVRNDFRAELRTKFKDHYGG